MQDLSKDYRNLVRSPLKAHRPWGKGRGLLLFCTTWRLSSLARDGHQVGGLESDAFAEQEHSYYRLFVTNVNQNKGEILCIAQSSSYQMHLGIV